MRLGSILLTESSVVATVDELVVDGEVAGIDALAVGVERLERRVVVQVQPAVAALVHDTVSDAPVDVFVTCVHVRKASIHE